MKKEFAPFEKRIWLASPTMHGPEMEYMKEAFDTNWMSTVGENLNRVEEKVCELMGGGYGVALSSGTSALHMAVKLAGVKPGEKVFCTDMTFSATVNPVVYEGGVPVFIDTEYDTWNMDPRALEKAFEMYPDVRTVVLAHLYGTPARFDEIRKICDEHGAVIIEDAAESLGATYKGLQTGGLGDISAISFNGNNKGPQMVHPVERTCSVVSARGGRLQLSHEQCDCRRSEGPAAVSGRTYRSKESDL